MPNASGQTQTLNLQTLDPHQKLTLDIYRELIEINTVHPHGDNTAAARSSTAASFFIGW